MIIALRFSAWPHLFVGDCMEPAIKNGERRIVSRILPYLRQYQIGDIITFKHDDKLWFSRIVALETDTIQISEGKVIVNDITGRANNC